MNSEHLAPSLAEAALCRARLYRPARKAYQRVANRPYYAQRAQDRAFLRQFVPRGSLAFDIGANRGLYSELLLDAGAERVVACEPHPGLAAVIRRRYRGVTVVEAAVREDKSDAVLHIGRDDVHSSVAREWVDLIRDAPDAPDRWENTISVPSVTLADLFLAHGEPAFMKIDVEGGERDVLATLDRPIRALSFEYQCPNLAIARDCLQLLEQVGNYAYAAARGERLDLATGWMDAEGLLADLEAERDRQANAHGDVFARLV